MSGKVIGLSLAVSSSILIGSSFIITKRGLEHPNYLQSKTYWLGMSCMALGEVLNFLAYSFTSAITVTPLGALSVVFGNILAFIFLKENMSKVGWLGVILCLLGAVLVILNSPEEEPINSVTEMLNFAVQPGFLAYLAVVLSATYFLMYKVEHIGKKRLFIYLTICSAVGSITVIACKAFGIAIKLTIEGNNQLAQPSTWAFLVIMILCITTQMTYFNKALDGFASNVVTPIYYCGFTSLTIVANVILFKDRNSASPKDVLGVLIGFIISFIGVYVINDQSKKPAKGYDELTEDQEESNRGVEMQKL
eukprot:NODE_78_length_23131_cov_0.599427.p8 type:complete len:307 gc:universal NODE_78_length_23131_cov_0.599427:16632-17552(+)